MHTLTNYRYMLQPYTGPASRHRCPQCNKPKTFTLYFDTQTGHTIHPTAGKCDRLVNCGYHLTPAQYFKAQGLQQPRTTYALPVKRAPIPTSFIDESVVQQSLQYPHHNNLVMYLADAIGASEAEQLANTYRIGTGKHWPGATVFWQTDIHGRTRTGKIMLYGRHTGRRIKEPHNHISWAHTALKLPAYNLQQCLFGEHLLRNNYKPVAIVESEKTALIASLYCPKFTWLATGGLSNLNANNCRILKGRQVMLVPDLNAHTAWQQKARALGNITNFKVSNLLQQEAPTQHQLLGYDLADYLVKVDYREW